MARIFIDGFEGGDYNLWDSIYQDGTGNVFTTTPPTGMTGSYCLKIQWQGYARKNIPAASTYYFGLKWRYADNMSYCIFSWLKGTTLLGYIARDLASGMLKLYIGSTLTVTSTKFIPIDVPCLYELYVYIADSSGRVVVKVNGETVIDYTGDTKPGSDTQIDCFGLGDCGSRVNGCGYYDDIVVDDAAYPGNTKIQYLVPTGAGNSTQWTPSTGSNYACVDEKPLSDTDYISTNTTNNLDTYALGDMSGSIGAVKSVQAQCRAKYEGTPTPTKLDLVLRSGGTDYPGSDKTLTSAYAHYSSIWNTDPADSAAWTDTKVNALEAGVKAIA